MGHQGKNEGGQTPPSRSVFLSNASWAAVKAHPGDLLVTTPGQPDGHPSWVTEALSYSSDGQVRVSVTQEIPNWSSLGE